MSWKLTVRAGPRVERRSFERLDDALGELEQRAGALTSDARRRTVDVRLRRFEPSQQVAARLELAGPQRWLPAVHVGIDVRGDGSTEAYQGRVRRTLIEPGSGETSVQALRRAVTTR